MKLLIEKEKEEVGNKIFSGIMLTLLLTSMSTLALNIRPVEASETIYIRANGSVEPSTANITSVDNITYTFTGNIYDSIVVEIDNIVVDGVGYTVQGTGSGKGIDLSGRNNVTIRNMKIGAFFDYGIYLYGSSNSSIIGNSITNNTNGIWVEESSSTTLRDNRMRGNIYNFGVFGSKLSHFINDVDSSNTVDGKLIYYWVDRSDEVVPSDAGYVAVVNSTGITVKNLDLKNNEQGILLSHTHNSTIAGNKIENNGLGIYLSRASNNSISENNITANNDLGICLWYYCLNNSILENNMTNNYRGICLWYYCLNNNISGNNLNSIYLYESSNNIMSGNNIAASNGNGIWLDYSSSSNIISGNNIAANARCGVYLYYSSGNSIFGNEITANNWYGIHLAGTSSNNSIVANNITANNWDGIHIYHSSSNNNIAGNNIASNTNGICLWASSNNNNVTENNLIGNSYRGIWLYSSFNNNIVENNIAANNDCGIFLYGSSDNEIYHNNVNNIRHVHIDIPSYANVWDDGYPSGGNHWSDHNPQDEDKDKIGDVPYAMDENNTDRYPLIYPYEFYQLGYVPKSDINKDGTVNIIDIAIVAKAFNTKPGDENWNPIADMNINEIINIIDVAKAAMDFGKKIENP